MLRIRARADTASIKAKVYFFFLRVCYRMRTVVRVALWLLLQCTAALQPCMEQMLWSRMHCWVQWHWYFTHFKLFYFPIIIGLVQRILRFVMHTELEASYRMVQYEYPYRYTPNIYTSHRSEYTPHIFVNIWLYLLMWQHWRSDTLLQCKVVPSVHFCEILCIYNMSQYSYLCY